MICIRESCPQVCILQQQSPPRRPVPAYKVFGSRPLLTEQLVPRRRPGHPRPASPAPGCPVPVERGTAAPSPSDHTAAMSSSSSVMTVGGGGGCPVAG